jgi:hypothetical protein
MSFFSWAHNNGVMDAEAVDDLPAGVATRIARVWLGQETGTVGTTRIRFNLSAVMGAGGVVGNNELANVRLLVDADGTFASGATVVSPATFNNTTDIIEFNHDFTAGTGFYFTVGSVDRASAPLPVELLSFTARPTSQGTVVEWVTASEYNCDFFEVQVSTSDNIWTALERVSGQGTTNLQTAYEYIDKQPLMGKSYYRLRQVDFDGKEDFSEVVLVIYETDAVNIYPNPSSEYVTIQVDEEVGFIQRLTISSLQGTKQWEKVFASVGTQKYQVDISGLPGGVYLVHIDGSRSRAMKKLVVINSR